MDNSFILSFLSDLAEHNNRTWFALNKDRYLNAVDLFTKEVADFIVHIAQFDNNVQYLRPKDCIFRIYRDIRFSPDKSPYKRHFGAYIAPKGGRKSPFGGYYLHIEPGNSVLCGGIFCPDKTHLRMLRTAVDENFNEFRHIIENRNFTKQFDGIYSPEVLQRIPVGFSSESPATEYLKNKHFSIAHYLSDDEMCKADFFETTLEIFHSMKPFNDFCNEALEL